MTKYLEANFLMWQKNSFFRTIFTDSGNGGSLDFNMSNLTAQTNPPFNQVRNLTQMPVDGNFVGMIIHVRNSNSNGEAEFVLVKGVEQVPGSQINDIEPTLSYTETPISIKIPALATGFFFSDPDIPEFNRAFAQDEYIGIKRRKNSGGQSLGLFSQTTVMWAFELKTT